MASSSFVTTRFVAGEATALCRNALRIASAYCKGFSRLYMATDASALHRHILDALRWLMVQTEAASERDTPVQPRAAPKAGNRIPGALFHYSMLSGSSGLYVEPHEP